MTDDYLWHKAEPIPAGPVAHALVVGTSFYSNLPADGREGLLGLRQLDCGASAAYRFALWLRNHQSAIIPPIATIRLLLTPSEQERMLLQDLDFNSIPNTTGDNVQDALFKWQYDCQERFGNIAILYLCGHGVLESPDQVYVLLNDAFRYNNLDNAVSVAPTQQALGVGNLHASIIFVDACQQILNSEWDLSGGRKLAPPRNATKDNRIAAPIYYAASPGGSAYGKA